MCVYIYIIYVYIYMYIYIHILFVYIPQISTDILITSNHMCFSLLSLKFPKKRFESNACCAASASCVACLAS